MCALDDEFKQQVDEYIQDHIAEVTNNQNLCGLPRLQVEVIGADENLLSSCTERHLFGLVQDWVKTSLDDTKPKLERLTEKVNFLYLCTDNTLRDCKDLEDSNLKQDEFVQDYKKLVRRQSGFGKGREATENGASLVPGQPFHKFSINPEMPVTHKEWSTVACYKTAENTYLAIMMLCGKMAVVSLHFRLPQNSPYNSSSEGPDSPVTTPAPITFGLFDRYATLIPLAPMSSPRCGFGIRAVGGKIIACGGYDRGECLKTAEEFDLETNTWIMLPEMHVARGRLASAQLNGKLYAIGGSDGHHELQSVECYDPVVRKWSLQASLLQERSSPGVAVLGGKIYCIGGSVGQCGISKCEVFSSDTNSWMEVAPLNTARFQAAVRAFNGQLYAIGGTDGWNCLNSVEIYNPDTNVWEIGSPLNVQRRGAGIEVVCGKLYVVGGSDGTRSLKTTEVFDPVDGEWSFAPALSTCRANVGAAVLGDRLFAIGGFCGKRFLDSMEYLESGEWCSYAPARKMDSVSGDNSCHTGKGASSGYPGQKKESGSQKQKQKGGSMNGDHKINLNGISNGH